MDSIVYELRQNKICVALNTMVAYTDTFIEYMLYIAGPSML